MRRQELTAQQAILFDVITTNGPVTKNQIVELSGLDKDYVKNNILRLLDRRFIERIREPKTRSADNKFVEHVPKTFLLQHYWETSFLPRAEALHACDQIHG